MRLPDAEGLIVAAQVALENNDIVYLHDAEGAPVVAMVAMPFFTEMTSGEHFPPREYAHDHIESEEDVPW